MYPPIYSCFFLFQYLCPYRQFWRLSAFSLCLFILKFAHTKVRYLHRNCWYYTVFDHTRVIAHISNNGVHTVENADVHTGKTPTCIPVIMDSSIRTEEEITVTMGMGLRMRASALKRNIRRRSKTKLISKHSLASHFEQFCAASSIFRWGCLFYVLTPENYPPIRPDLVFSILHNTTVHSVVAPFLLVKLPPFGVLFAVLRRK